MERTDSGVLRMRRDASSRFHINVEALKLVLKKRGIRFLRNKKRGGRSFDHDCELNIFSKSDR